MGNYETSVHVFVRSFIHSPIPKVCVMYKQSTGFLNKHGDQQLGVLHPPYASVVFLKRTEVGEECAEREKWRALFLQVVKIVCGTKKQKMKRLGGALRVGPE